MPTTFHLGGKMTKLRNSLAGLAFLLFTGAISAETVGIFSDTTIGQIKFASGDVKAALESKGLTVEILPLSSLTTGYPNKKVIIALSSNTGVTTLLAGQGGTAPTAQGEQAYALRTTTSPQPSFWALGGDNNGAMYGGLQIAENINFEAFAGNYNTQESPSILKRGIKLNVPWDAKSPTYWNKMSLGSINAIPNIWDMTFWQTWFDEMARNRFNVFSLWSNHPFTSLIKLPGYEDCAILTH
jgi:hypothetical protein